MEKISKIKLWVSRHIVYIAIALIAAAYVLLRCVIPSSLNEYPHNAQVWGTVSDWVMVAVTAVTAYFIWRTLDSQMQVQKSQDIQTLMLTDEYTAKIYPQLNIRNLANVPTENVSRQTLINSAHRFKITIENSGGGDARNTKFLKTKHNDDTLVGDIHVNSTIPSEVVFEKPLVQNNNLGLEWLVYNLKIQYTDRMGSEYKQDVYARISYLSLPDNEEIIIPGLPVFQIQGKPILVKHFYNKKD